MSRWVEEDPKERFLRSVNKTETCWLWTGAQQTSGYGQFFLFGKIIGAHRASVVLFRGDFDRALHVCHTCDIKLCVNPEHLFLGTPKDNIRDCINKGRNSKGDSHRAALANRDFKYDEEHARRTSEHARRGADNVSAKLTEVDVHEIRYGKFVGLPQAKVGRALGVSQSLICMVRKRQIWEHLP